MPAGETRRLDDVRKGGEEGGTLQTGVERVVVEGVENAVEVS